MFSRSKLQQGSKTGDIVENTKQIECNHMVHKFAAFFTKNRVFLLKNPRS